MPGEQAFSIGRRILTALFSGGVLLVFSWVGSAQASAEAPQLPGLNKAEKQNIEKVVQNFDDLIKDADNIIKSGKGINVWVPTPEGRKKLVTAFEAVDDYKAALANLKAKFKGGRIHPIPGLNDPKPPKYLLGDPSTEAGRAGHPRAAYGVPGTYVLIENQWVPCPEGDILIDKKYTDPGQGKPIDETTEQGWKDKWRLLHILVHEKWHERMITEQVEFLKDLNKGSWKMQPESEKKRKIKEAKEQGASAEAHPEVYKAQKRLLFLKWEMLRRQKELLEKAIPRDKEAIQRIEKQLKWLLDEVTDAESSLARALKEESDWEYSAAGGAGNLKNGTLAVYITWGADYWRLDVDLVNGRAADFRVPEMLFFGTLHRESPVLHVPSLYVAMPQKIYTALDVQSDPRQVLEWAEANGLIRTGRDFGDIREAIPRLAARSPESAGAFPAAKIGIVVPRDVQPGETVSGGLVTNPDDYARIPGLRLIAVRAPLRADEGGRATLRGVVMDTGDGRQPADGPVTLHIPEKATGLSLIVRSEDSDSLEIEASIPLDRRPPPAQHWTGGPDDYQISPVCVLDSLQAIWGPLGGDANVTRLEVDGLPARIISESPRAVYWLLPEAVTPGRHRVVLGEGPRRAAFPIFVISLDMSADRLDLQRGQSTRYHIRLRGLEGFPENGWQRAGVPSDLVDLGALEEKIPGFSRPPTGQPGEITLVLKNASPQTITVPDMAENVRIFHLSRSDFAEGGVFSHDGTIQSIQSGGFILNGKAWAFLEAIRGEPDRGTGGENISDTPEARRIRLAYNRLQETRRNFHRAMDKTEKALEDGKKTAPQEVVEEQENAQREARKAWGRLVEAGAQKDAAKTDEKERAYDKAKQDLDDLHQKSDAAKEKLIDSMSKEARRAYLDAEDAEREALHQYSEAQKEMDRLMQK